MADEHAPMPSEDEEFDTVTDSEREDEQPSTHKTVVVKDESSDEAEEEEATEEPGSSEDVSEPELEEETAPAEPDVADESTTPLDIEAGSAPEPEEAETESEETSEPEPQSEAKPETHAAEHHPVHIPAELPAHTVTGHKKKQLPIHLAIELVLLLALVGVSLWAWSLHSDRSNLQDQLATINANPQALLQKQSDALIQRVGHLVTLPKDETPTVANVTDAAEAKSQSSFFNSAQNGDKVLVYVKEGYAVLYRPSTDKVIFVGPLSTANNSASSATNTTTTNKAVTSTNTTGNTSR